MLRYSPAVLLAGLLLAATGCGERTADVSGSVRYKGKTLATGSVVFFSGTKHAPVVAAIGPDGRFTAKGVPAGSVTVTVSSPNPTIEGSEIRARGKEGKPVDDPGAPAVDPKLWFAIPDKYGDPDRTDLSYTLKAGPNDLDIEVK